MSFRPVRPPVGLFSFQWRLKGEEYAHPKIDYWKTVIGAAKAAGRWTSDKADEGHEVETRVIELVPNGTGRKSIPLSSEAGEWR